MAAVFKPRELWQRERELDETGVMCCLSLMLIMMSPELRFRMMLILKLITDDVEPEADVESDGDV